MAEELSSSGVWMVLAVSWVWNFDDWRGFVRGENVMLHIPDRVRIGFSFFRICFIGVCSIVMAFVMCFVIWTGLVCWGVSVWTSWSGRLE